jgi:hypothetical protein
VDEAEVAEMVKGWEWVGQASIRPEASVRLVDLFLTAQSMSPALALPPGNPAHFLPCWYCACRTIPTMSVQFAISTGRPVAWTSPLGFPIEQPYRKLPTYQVWTPLQVRGPG